jgi:outer membrane protein assembly factor BamB
MKTMPRANGTIYIGIRGRVIALERKTGTEVWNTPLIGGDFVNVTLDGDLILASTKGEIFGLHAETGEKLWRNKLPGMGTGLMTIATSDAPTGVVLFEEQRRIETSQSE